MFRRQLIYVQVRQDHFIARAVGEGRTIRRDSHALGNGHGRIRDFSRIRFQLKGIVSELKTGFSLRRPWLLLHFDPVEYPVTQEELADFHKVGMRCGVNFCWLSKWEHHHEDKDLLNIFELG